MARKTKTTKPSQTPKAVLKLPDRDQAKSAVLNSLSSADAQRGYGHAIEAASSIEWYCSEPRLSFNRSVVVRIESTWRRAIWRLVRSTCASVSFGV